jgi:outer membrane protein assembly factor BamB
MGFKGNVESFNLADVFQNLASNQQTGTLRVYANNGEEKNVFFQTGQVRHLSKGSKATLVTGEVFLARGLVPRAALELANERQKESGRAIGACLIDLGHINQEQLEEVTRHQIEEEIFDLFSWDHANFEFSDGTPQSLTTTGVMPANGPALPISHLIMEAARRVDEWERLRKQIPQYKEIYSMDVAVRRAIESGEMEMDPVEKRVAALIDGARDVDDLIEDSALFKFEVVNALAGFVQSSLLRPASVEELRLAEEDCARQNLPRRRIKVLERVLALGGENPKVRRDLAEILARSGETERACIHFSVLADGEIQAGREDNAMELYKRVLSISPRHVKAHEQLAAIQNKRGKKREAFTHYQELFDLFREQNHMREARAAAACALECEPQNGELRMQLIELLLADKQTDAAAQQLELMGDQAARQNNVKLASDTYRRAMQYRPGNKQLKKKLADAMLTKEDRRSRKQKLYTVVALIVVAGIAGGVLYIIETNNAAKLKSTDDAAAKIGEHAKSLEQAEKYAEAKEDYSRAANLYEPLGKLFSPLFRYGETSRKHAQQYADNVQRMNERARDQGDTLRKRAKADFDDALSKGSALSVFEKRDIFDRIIKNEYAEEEVKHSAADEMAKVNMEIAEFENGKARLAKNPAVEFQSLEQETAFKREFWNRFKKYLSAEDIKMPVLIKPNADEVDVSVDKNPKGVVSQTADNERNTFRLSIVPSHKFEFKKTGYRTVVMNTSELTAPSFVLKLEREHAFRIDLQREEPGIVLSGEALVYNNAIIVGTESGALLQLGDADKPIVRRYNLPNATAALNKEVVGKILPCVRPGKSDLLIYTTRAGDVIALDTASQKFTEAFKTQLKSSRGVVGINPQTPPVLAQFKIYGNKPILVAVENQNIFLIDCESGNQMPFSKDLRVAATSAPLAVADSSMVIVGCGDGNLYGVEIGRDVPREWSTGHNGAVLGRPIIIDEKLVAGTADGNLYVFDATKNIDRRPELYDFGGSLEAELLVFNRHVYVGSTLKDGFNAVDVAGRKKLFSRTYPSMGNIQFSAAGNNNNVYFCTDTGRLF